MTEIITPDPQVVKQQKRKQKNKDREKRVRRRSYQKKIKIIDVPSSVLRPIEVSVSSSVLLVDTQIPV